MSNGAATAAPGSVAVGGASARRQEPLTVGPPMPFEPLPDCYTPCSACKEAFLSLCPDPAGVARWRHLAAAIEYKADEAHDDVGAARGQTPDEVFAIAAYTADARPAGFTEGESVYFRLNALLRKRDMASFEPFKDFYWYLRSALGKIPTTACTVWRGLASASLEQLGPRYREGRTVCLVAFTSVTTHASVMQDFAGGTEGVLLKIQATEARSIAEYSLFPQEAELLLAPNAMLKVEVALSATQATTIATFPGSTLPTGVALIALHQQPTTVPVLPAAGSHVRVPPVAIDAPAPPLFATAAAATTPSSSACEMSPQTRKIARSVSTADIRAGIAILNSNTTSVDAPGSQIDDVAVSALANRCPMLRHLNVSHTQSVVSDVGITTVAHHCPQLQHLNVGGTDGHVTDAAIMAVAHFCPQLQHLDVSRTGRKVTDASITVVAQLCPLLQHLNVSGLPGSGVLTDEGIAAVARHCPQLQHLDVSRTGGDITDTSITMVAHRCPQLQHLDVSYTSGKVTDASITAVAQGCPQLQRLDVSSTQARITDASIMVVARHCPKLQFLQLQDTHNGVTDAGIRALAHGCPQLEQLLLGEWGRPQKITCAAITTLKQAVPFVDIVGAPSPKDLNS